MMDAIVVVGLSRTILVIMKSGLIIDTVVYACASLMNGLPQWATAEMMLIFQNFLNFFICESCKQFFNPDIFCSNSIHR